MPVYFLMYHAKPTEDNEEKLEVGGAYINCYIEAHKIEEAASIAKPVISELNWEVVEVEEEYEVKREDFTNNSEGLDYFEQALVDKQVYVVHTYPIEEEG